MWPKHIKYLPFQPPIAIIQRTRPVIIFTVNREKCEKLGVNISDVFTTMQAYMGSLFVNNFTLYNRTFHVVVQADTVFRTHDMADMNKYYVRNSGEREMVPLKHTYQLMNP